MMTDDRIARLYAMVRAWKGIAEKIEAGDTSAWPRDLVPCERTLNACIESVERILAMKYRPRGDS